MGWAIRFFLLFLVFATTSKEREGGSSDRCDDMPSHRSVNIFDEKTSNIFTSRKVQFRVTSYFQDQNSLCTPRSSLYQFFSALFCHLDKSPPEPFLQPIREHSPKVKTRVFKRKLTSSPPLPECICEEPLETALGSRPIYHSSVKDNK